MIKALVSNIFNSVIKLGNKAKDITHISEQALNSSGDSFSEFQSSLEIKCSSSCPEEYFRGEDSPDNFSIGCYEMVSHVSLSLTQQCVRSRDGFYFTFCQHV